MGPLLALLLLLASPAAADSGMLLGGVANRQMPLDAVTTSLVAGYSTRRLLTSYTANKAMNVVRASDSATSDIGFRADGNPDTATLATFCAATTCKLVTLYDQVSTRDLTQATDGNRFTVQQASLRSLWPAFQATASTQTHAAASSITPASTTSTAAVIKNRSAGTGICASRLNGANNRFVTTTGVANQWFLQGGSSGGFGATAADSAYHAGIGVISGASSVIRIDSTETTGTTGGNTTAGAPAIVGGAGGTTCNEVEFVIWDSPALSAAQRIFVGNSAQVFGGL